MSAEPFDKTQGFKAIFIAFLLLLCVIIEIDKKHFLIAGIMGVFTLVAFTLGRLMLKRKRRAVDLIILAFLAVALFVLFQFLAPKGQANGKGDTAIPSLQGH